MTTELSEPKPALFRQTVPPPAHPPESVMVDQAAGESPVVYDGTLCEIENCDRRN